MWYNSLKITKGATVLILCLATDFSCAQCKNSLWKQSKFVLVISVEGPVNMYGYLTTRKQSKIVLVIGVQGLVNQYGYLTTKKQSKLVLVISVEGPVNQYGYVTSR